jgi:hypothetical protein
MPNAMEPSEAQISIAKFNQSAILKLPSTGEMPSSRA